MAYRILELFQCPCVLNVIRNHLRIPGFVSIVGRGFQKILRQILESRLLRQSMKNRPQHILLCRMLIAKQYRA